MKKRLLVLIVLLSVAVCAEEGIPRYHDFPLDNIHILRLQEAASSLGGNVSDLKAEMRVFEEQQSREIREVRREMAKLQGAMTAQLNALQNEVARGNPPKIQAAQVAQQQDEGIPTYLTVLLALAVFLLIFVIILVFWLWERHKEHEVEDHIHPAPDDLIKYVGAQLKEQKSLHDIRLELADMGWPPSIIEHAIHAAKEKR